MQCFNNTMRGNVDGPQQMDVPLSIRFSYLGTTFIARPPKKCMICYSFAPIWGPPQRGGTTANNKPKSTLPNSGSHKTERIPLFIALTASTKVSGFKKPSNPGRIKGSHLLPVQTTFLVQVELLEDSLHLLVSAAPCGRCIF